MGVYKFKLPDVGEGVTEAEIVEWHVKTGDAIAEDDTMVDVMTDKATVELPSPVSGVIKATQGAPGDVIATGTVIVEIEIEGDPSEVEDEAPEPEPKDESAESSSSFETPDKPAPQDEDDSKRPHPEEGASAPVSKGQGAQSSQPVTRAAGERVLASPAVRQRALEQDIDLGDVPGTGPAGRIEHRDLDDFIAAGGRLVARAGSGGGGGRAARSGETKRKIIGLRRKIAENMALAKRTIPHITYVDEVDVTALEDLRAHMNATRGEDQPKLTIIPFLVTALARALPDFPHANAHFDTEASELTEYAALHCGIAAATPNGLMVPVIRNAEAMDVWTIAGELKRLADAARSGKAKAEELSGSTITITSLGAIGGVVTTPVINHPETAIIGVNRLQTLPRYDEAGRVVPRKIMNLSSSFDHRIVDGYDAAQLVQALKSLLENPATLFMED